MRTFDTGATRDSNQAKPDYRGFLSAPAIQRFGEYMHKHRVQADGSLRASDNWKRGIPIESYLESAVRHMVDLMAAAEPPDPDWEAVEELACAVWFNIQGMLHVRAVQRAGLFSRNEQRRKLNTGV